MHLNASELLDDLSVRMYEPPLSGYRYDGRIGDTTNPLSVVMLLIDYEAECTINGIIGFLGNSAGSRLPETIVAMRKIGCIDHANILEEIQATATAAGMTYEAMQEDCAELTEFDATSFAELHGDKWNDACNRIQTLHENVGWDMFWLATLEFVRNNMDSIARHSTAQ
jgi:hypothetical protein